ncbi:enoyl-CoA hydratase/isomerase family protein [Ancylomarina sp. 16SWW S1-10-2]|uniref:enoyl-CoA hydratase/isomerase family protein n=1 Tax=Ancylomarina sp. 16SWW S1-10-2 TaxID=2499681 RepID=UPI0012AE3D54|nr:enoyl-CoA hydratase/isomerase family protein [Ancylomarina sp. 16SWW S1-10-2]MRT92035.1 enoyl-CoA hydratase/isomerase family protein [Ancylomarina sp. 16SWW S1-10-2]
MNNKTSEIVINKNDRTVCISLNRLPANSYYEGFLQQLSKAIKEASADPKVKVILLNSTSEKFFCAGADIKIFSSNTVEQNNKMVVAAREVTTAITESKKIIIAAIKGHCLGGGLEMVMACDIRLGAEGNYLIGLPEVKLGLMPGNGGAPRMIDLLGASRAMELLVTGNNINPQKAYDFGLFNQLFPADEFEESVTKYVANIAIGAGEAMAAVKQFVQNHKGMNVQQGLDYETECVSKLYDTPDAKEGFQAFVEKRAPKYI